MKKLIGITVLLFTFQVCFGHPWKPKHFAIVVTNATPDELKAIPILFASPAIQVLGIITHGSTENEAETQKMLNAINHEGVLTGFFNTNQSSSAQKAIQQIISNKKDSITIINLSKPVFATQILIMAPDLKKQVNKIVHFNDTQNLNPNITINLSDGEFMPSLHFMSSLETIQSDYGRYYSNNLSPDKGFTAEVISLYLHAPELFVSQLDKILLDKHLHDTAEVILLRLLKNNISSKNQVFSSFPIDTSLYINDIAGKTEKVILKYGHEEWMACVLTSELHRHLGVYALIGAKMGVRAKNYFGAGVDEMKITTYAGQQPPVSCFNDGLQVSTGATIGHGLIHILDTAPPMPRAEFSYLGQTIVMQLKPEYEKRIKREVKNLVIAYGTQSDEYWDLLRSVALNLWFSWDRNEIFTIEQLP